MFAGHGQGNFENKLIRGLNTMLDKKNGVIGTFRVVGVFSGFLLPFAQPDVVFEKTASLASTVRCYAQTIAISELNG